MIQSQTALRNDIDNTPNESQIENLKALCENVLQPLSNYDWIYYSLRFSRSIDFFHSVFIL